jgi:hypothetical protein
LKWGADHVKAGAVQHRRIERKLVQRYQDASYARELSLENRLSPLETPMNSQASICDG